MGGLSGLFAAFGRSHPRTASSHDNERRNKMKVIGFNGSPRKDGNTGILIHKVFHELEKEGIETELVQLSHKKIHGCISEFDASVAFESE